MSANTHSVKVVNFACYLCWYLSWFRNTCPGSANLQMGLRISSSTNVIFDQHSLTGSLWLAHDSFTFALINTFQNLNLLLHSTVLCKIQNYFSTLQSFAKSKITFALFNTLHKSERLILVLVEDALL